MNNNITKEEKEITLTTILLNQLVGDYWKIERLTNNVNEEIEKQNYKKTIYELEQLLEETKEIKEVQEEIKIAYEYLKEMDEQQFIEIKKMMKRQIEFVKKEKIII